MGNAWPRVGLFRGVVGKGVCVGWVRCLEMEQEGEVAQEGKAGLEEVKVELKEVVGMLDAVCVADENIGVFWEGEKRRFVEADGRLVGLFEGVGK